MAICGCRHPPVGYAPWIPTAAGFFLICLIALSIALFSASASFHFSTSMYDRRFGQCPVYSCDPEMPRIAVVIAFLSSEVSALLSFLSGIETNSSIPSARHLFDLFLVLIDEPSPNRATTQSVSAYVDRSHLTRFFSSVRVVPPFANVPGPNELLKHFLFHPKLFTSHCFLQYISLQTRLLRPDWLDGIAIHSTNASSKNFWIKGGLDMSFHPFSYLEHIEITLYSLYAAHSECLRDLIDLAEEDHPTWPVARSMTRVLRNPANVKLAHMLGTRMLPTSISVSFKGSVIHISDIKERFPDAYWAEGTRILG
jgi:hypothetical protein